MISAPLAVETNAVGGQDTPARAREGFGTLQAEITLWDDELETFNVRDGGDLSRHV